jgi:hypothetical protein
MAKINDTDKFYEVWRVFEDTEELMRCGYGDECEFFDTLEYARGFVDSLAATGNHRDFLKIVEVTVIRKKID